MGFFSRRVTPPPLTPISVAPSVHLPAIQAPAPPLSAPLPLSSSSFNSNSNSNNNNNSAAKRLQFQTLSKSELRSYYPSQSTSSFNMAKEPSSATTYPPPHATTVSNMIPMTPSSRKRTLSHSVLEILAHQEAEVSTRIYDHWRAYIAEFLGTFFLFFIAMTLSNIRPLNTDTTLLGFHQAFGVCFTIIALIFALGDVSGAHMNPAVTFCLVIVRAFPINIGLIYIVVQILGGFAAAGASYGVLRSNGNQNGFLPMEPNLNNTSLVGAFFIEWLLSSFFFYVILATGVDTRGPAPRHHLAPLPIGFALGACAMLGAPFGGVSLNPVGSLLPSILVWRFGNMWVYPLATFTAALTVAIWYKLIFMSRPTQQELKEKKAMQLKNRESVFPDY